MAIVGLPGPVNHARLGCLGAFFVSFGAASTVSKWSDKWVLWAIGGVLITGFWSRSQDQFRIEKELHDPEPLAWTQKLREVVGCLPGQSNCGRVLGLGGIS